MKTLVGSTLNISLAALFLTGCGGMVGSVEPEVSNQPSRPISGSPTTTVPSVVTTTTTLPTVVVPGNHKILITKGDPDSVGTGVAKLYSYNVVTGEEVFLSDAHEGFHIGLMSAGTEKRPNAYGTELGEKAYFYWNDENEEHGFWETDFTQAGTRMIQGLQSFYNNMIYAFDGKVLVGDQSKTKLFCAGCGFSTKMFFYDPIDESFDNIYSGTATSVTDWKFFSFETSGLSFMNYEMSMFKGGFNLYHDGQVVSSYDKEQAAPDARSFEKMGNKLIGWADSEFEYEPSVIDPVTGESTMLVDIGEGSSSTPGPIVVVNDNLAYFIANGSNLYSTDGTPEGTSYRASLAMSFIDDVLDFKVLGTGLILNACSSSPGYEGCQIWFYSIPLEASAYAISSLNNKSYVISDFISEEDDRVLFYVENIDSSAVALWSTDGTSVGTELITGLGENETLMREYIYKNNKLFFTSYDRDTGEHSLLSLDANAKEFTRVMSLGYALFEDGRIDIITPEAQTKE